MTHYRGKATLQSNGSGGSSGTAGYVPNAFAGFSGTAPQHIGPITISGLTPSSIQFDTMNINMWHEEVKKYEIIESPEDTLTLSVVWKRLRDENINHNISSLLHRDLFSYVTSEDRIKADEIRDFYSKKIMMWKLKSDTKLSKYRTDLNNFIHTDGKTVREDMFGLIYYLPMFYSCDLQLEDVRSQVNPHQHFKKLKQEQKPDILSLSTALTPIRKITKKNKHKTVNQYWLKDDTLNAAVLITVPSTPVASSLEHLWEHIFYTEKVLKIKGVYYKNTIDDFEHYCVKNWSIDRG